jgi:hypothetical protein
METIEQDELGKKPPTSPPAFAWLFIGKVILLFVTILVVWALYAYLHVYRLDWLGWFYASCCHSRMLCTH